MPPTSDVRTRILDTAYGLLAEHGVAHLTQPRVSRAAGVRQSHLTYYFPTRGELLVAVARHSMAILSRPMLAQARVGALAPRQLPSILVEALTDRRRIRVMLGLVAAADEDPKVRGSLRQLVQLVRERLAALCTALSLPGDPDTVALLHTFVVGAAVIHHARADEAARREANAAVEFITGLLPSLGRSRRGPRPAGIGTRRRASGNRSGRARQ